MRGKLTVLVILIGGALMYWYGFWFMNSLSPADLRFNMTRKALPEQVRIDQLFPPTLPDHKIVAPPSTEGDSPKLYSSQYEKEDGKRVHLSAWQFASKDQAKAWLDAVPGGCKESPHREAKVPYIYLECSGQPSSLYRFRWINGLYSFEVEALDLEHLVHFVNNYSF